MQEEAVASAEGRADAKIDKETKRLEENYNKSDNSPKKKLASPFSFSGKIKE